MVGIDTQKSEIYVDRSASGAHDFHELFAAVHSAKLTSQGAVTDLRIYVDRASVEVFGNGGQAVISDLIFPGPGSNALAAFAGNEDDLFLSLNVYRLSLADADGGSR
ncbi:Levanase precursor [compost metagenome]